ncbi:uncharacterized protein CG4449 [Nasonia vitripennis]|uniref:Ubiquitin-like domain-containing protein n=1 Tax=Nasonia vitripennis TaxID=7425 RepID=A0A7M7H971_NASVI|nr:uncharacterized protein CG4449 [Nasonia vitripennis]XP_008214936.1 uncharacterized protein CG4449 [Nasonia vitripennis]
MDLSGSSSDDDGCNLYINAASKLNALNRQVVQKKKVDDDDEDDDMIIEESNNITAIDLINKIGASEKKEVIIDDSNLDEEECDTVEEIDEDEIVPVVVSEDVINCIDDDDDESDNRPNTKSRRTTKNSNKISSARNKISDVPPILRTNISINDSIERELNETYGDSFDLSQDENDSYVVIGSPPPAKKANTDDYEVSVKVLWKSYKVERFEIKRTETFQKVFRYFANLEGVPEDQIRITKKEKRITPFDTPVSIDWSIIDILDGGVVSAEIVKKNKTNSKNEVQETACKIKIQLLDKRTLTMNLKNDEPFTSLLKKCSTELGIPEAKIKLYFDGDLIDEEETPESLDIDEEACIDLKILK